VECKARLAQHPFRIDPFHHNRHRIYRHPCTSLDKDKEHYFVEYKDETTVDALLKLNTPLMHFYSLAVNPEFRDQFHRVAVVSERDNDHPSCPRTADCPMDFVPGSHIVTNDKANRLGFSRPAHGLANEERTPHIRQVPESVCRGPTCLPSPLDASMSNVGNIQLRSDKAHLDDSPSSALPSPTSVSPLYQAFTHVPASHCIHSVSPSPIQLHPGTVALPFSLNNKVALSICGQIVTYNLDELEDDPRTIIGLLKLISNERGNWMIVAAHYRRNKNPTAALAVMTAMLQGTPCPTARSPFF
jgi:hypothetical protein